MKLHKTTIPLYGIDFYFSQDREGILKFFDIEDCDTAVGFCITDRKNLRVGIHQIAKGRKNRMLSNLAHESFHAAIAVAEFVGLDVNYGDNEGVAYLISWINEYCLDCMDKDKKR